MSIKVGSIVNVNFVNTQTTWRRLKVKYMPTQPDDSWITEDKDGKEIYIKNYETIYEQDTKEKKDEIPF